MVDSVRSIIDLWDSPAAFAVEIGANVEAVRKWRQRGRIPADWWARIVRSSKSQAAGLTVEALAGLRENTQT